MRVFELPGQRKRYRSANWGFQQTFETPLEDAARFADTIMSALPDVTSATAVLDQVVFAPQVPDQGLLALYAKYSIPPQWYGNDLIIEAEGAVQAREMLEALLSEVIDFFFVPSPKGFVIYADHDQYITFLGHRKGPVSSVSATLKRAGYRPVDYVRKL